MLESVATALILGGIAVLGVAAWLIRRLIDALPAGPLGGEWRSAARAGGLPGSGETP